MPRTSAATLRRKARGQDSKPVDPALSAKRKAAAAARWSKQKGPEYAKQQRLAQAGQIGGLKASAPQIRPNTEVLHQQAFIAHLHEKARTCKALIAQKMSEGAVDAADYLLRLVRAEGDCVDAPHPVRRLAAIDILELAGIKKAGAAAGVPDPSRPIAEWSVAELEQVVDVLRQGQERVVVDAAPGEAAEAVRISSTLDAELTAARREEGGACK